MSEVRDPRTDQPLPRPGELPVQQLLIAAIAERRDLGIRKYGRALQTGNGRDMLIDAWEETIDLLVYLTGMRLEKGHDLGQGQPADKPEGQYGECKGCYRNVSRETGQPGWYCNGDRACSGGGRHEDHPIELREDERPMSMMQPVDFSDEDERDEEESDQLIETARNPFPGTTLITDAGNDTWRYDPGLGAWKCGDGDGLTLAELFTFNGPLVISHEIGYGT